MGSTRFPCCVKQSDGGNFFFLFSSTSCLLKWRRPEVSVPPYPAPGVPLPGSSPPKLTHQHLFTSSPAPPGATRAARHSLPTSRSADTRSLSSCTRSRGGSHVFFFFFSFFLSSFFLEGVPPNTQPLSNFPRTSTGAALGSRWLYCATVLLIHSNGPSRTFNTICRPSLRQSQST